jgi:hypothetical protein
MWLHECITQESPDLIRVNDEMHSFSFELHGWAPVQALGEVGTREFYFRARHTDWSCEVSDSSGELPSDGRATSDAFIREGKCPNASYMPLREALKVIDRCMSEYFAATESGE